MTGVVTLSSAQCDFLNKQIDFKVKKLSAESCIKKLSEDHNFTINYASNVFDDQLYSINVKQQTIEALLLTISKKQGAEFICVGSKSLVFRKKELVEPFVWSGFVLDSSSKQPVVDALVVHNDRWVETDEDGFLSNGNVHLTSTNNHALPRF